jgi:alkanesulfonate monooxygenase SsuD/methylene tetrahydromethanopterin reductase-like flavin-dependent oxidoreductase (luciferase family)
VRLGLNVGYLLGNELPDTVALAREADRLGYDVLWAAEAYSSDAPTLLSYLAAKTERIDVGAGVMQIPARTPTMTAMTAATIDLLSGGRFRLGLGVSGPQVSEGWHGVRFAKPLVRTREYVEVVRQALGRGRVEYDGEFFTLPLPDSQGKPLKLALRRGRDHLPIYLAAVGPRNLELAGEIADGWLAIFFSPDFAGDLLASIATGRARRLTGDSSASSTWAEGSTSQTNREGEGGGEGGFDVAASVPVSIGDDLERCAEPIRGYAALYIGGMGSREANFYNALARRMGYEESADRIQDLYLARDYREAMAAVPFEFIDRTSLLGPPGRLVERLQAFADAGVTTLNVSLFAPDPDQRIATLRRVSEALEASGRGN